MKKVCKRGAAIFLGCLLCLAVFTGCGTSDDSTTNVTGTDLVDFQQTPALKKPGVLTIGSEIGYPPMEYTTDNGLDYIGFDIDFAKALGETLGLEVEFVNTSWDGIFSGLEKGQYDMIISAVSITPERQEKYNLTAPYVSNYQCIVTAADKQDVKSPADFSGNRVAVQQATTSDDLITEQALTDPTIQIFRYEKVTQCFDELRLGRADAVYVDSVVAAYYTKDDPDYVRTWISDGREPMGVCIRKDNLKLLESVEAAINTLVFTGKLGEIAIRHFGDDFTTGLRDVIALPVIPPLDT